MYQHTNTFKYLGKELKEIHIEPCPIAQWVMDGINLKACFRNAQMISEIYECEYVEGEVVLMHPETPISIIHAWNCAGGKYFDVTWTKYPCLWDAGLIYFPVVQGYIDELISDGYKFDSVMDLTTQFWNYKN